MSNETVKRALSILDLLAEKPMLGSEVARGLKVHQSTAHRLLASLLEAGFVRRDGSKRYHLGSAILRLSNAVLEGTDLRNVARPHMITLRDSIRETVHLGVLEGSSVFYIEKVDSTQPITIMYSRVGRSAPLHCTAVAKAILASIDTELVEESCRGIEFTKYTENTHETLSSLMLDLEEVRERGWAADRQEHEIGIHCIAAPVKSASGAAIGAISVAAVSSRLGWEDFEARAPEIVETAQCVSREFGWSESRPAELSLPVRR
jgi:DNA-binding IclR family transcriptional regulator